MGEILSHAEVEAILCAIEPSPPSVRTVVIRDASDNVSENANWGCQDSRPEALRGAALKVVHALHEGICGRWQARLETLLQSQVVVRPVGACQSTVTVFFAAMTSPYVTGLISHAGSMAVSLLVWNTDLVRRLVGKMQARWRVSKRRHAAAYVGEKRRDAARRDSRRQLDAGR